MAQGHTLTIYTTEKTVGIPPGVIVKDAREIFDHKNIVRHEETGSVTLHSDIFRYQLLQKTSQIWVDLDIFCLRPLNFESEYVFAHEDADTINNALLRLPHNSPTLLELLKYTPEHRGYPPFFSKSKKLRRWLKSAGRKPTIAQWPWGAIGPRGLSYHLQRNQEIQYALASEAFYPIPLNDLDKVCTPNALQREALPNGSYAVHLWASQLKKYLQSQYAGRIPEGPFLDYEIDRLSAQFDYPIAKNLSA
jgi:hypothetical protein